MTDLDVLRLSAEACGHDWYIDAHRIEPRVYLRCAGPSDAWWNPLTDAEQRWECVEWLLKQNKDSWISLDSGNVNTYDWVAANEDHIVQIECPTAEFPARAVAELRKRKS